MAGTVFLSLPAARVFNGFSFITNLFTSVSAVCVTGLSIVNIGEYYSAFGQIIILTLTQLGGLGYMFVSTVVALMLGKMALKDRRIIQELFDISSFSGLKTLLLKAVLFVLGIEFAGAVALTLIFLKDFSFLRSVYLGIFYSITAFCNAGFSVFNGSLAVFSNNPAVLYVIAFLVFCGGVGFFVIVDIYDKYKGKCHHLSLHTKVVLFAAFIVAGLSFLLFLLSDILRGHGLLHLINNAFFQAVGTKTAGFHTVSLLSLSEFSKLVLMILMSVGAAPGSAAGGIKVTTVVLIFVFVKSVLTGNEDYILFRRRIAPDLIRKSLVIFIVFLGLVTLFSLILILQENYFRNMPLIFEVISAFSTSGLSLGVTPYLSSLGRIYIIIAMITGRIGILAMLMVMVNPIVDKKNIKYPEGRILVG
ncbi:MAG: hypothetical protein LBL71_02670 [Endomicrobium sp.]|nr:hypothetical protein [Endomicrobium sp.]